MCIYMYAYNTCIYIYVYQWGFIYVICVLFLNAYIYIHCKSLQAYIQQEIYGYLVLVGLSVK